MPEYSPESPLQCRLAQPADLDAMVALLALLFTQEAEFEPDAARQRAGLALLLAEPALGSVLVAVRAGRVVGMVALLFTLSSALGTRVALLEDLVLEPALRGFGHGRSLLEAAIAHGVARGCARVTLLTDVDNQRAQRLYTERGFVRSTMVPFRRLL